MIPTISQACSMHSDFATDIEEFAAAGFKSVEIWLTKLETFLQQNSLETAKRLLEQHQVVCPVASYQGGLLQAEGPALRECLAHFERRLALCVQLQIPTLVVAVDIAGPLTQELLERLHSQAGAIAEKAASHDMRIALEFQPDAVFLNNLKSLVQFLSEMQRPQLGVCLDVACFERSCSKESDLDMLSQDQLFHVQICDFESPYRELMSNNDRILPGDGRVDYQRLGEHLQLMGYGGAISIEIHNPTIWAIAARQTAEVALMALERSVLRRSCS